MRRNVAEDLHFYAVSRLDYLYSRYLIMGRKPTTDVVHSYTKCMAVRNCVLHVYWNVQVSGIL
jgi:hypothetical protein